MPCATANPCTGKTLKGFPNATDAAVKQAIEKGDIQGRIVIGFQK